MSHWHSVRIPAFMRYLILFVFLGSLSACSPYKEVELSDITNVELLSMDTRMVAVSYTHLDVYKRQGPGNRPVAEGERFGHERGGEGRVLELGPGPVSYTHLDVYKRQGLYR